MVKFLITVPHADGRDGPADWLDSDFGSSAQAVNLKTGIIASRAWPQGFDFDRGVVIIEGDTPRTVCNVNRRECRDTPFRRRITEVLEGDERVVVIDVHTSPPAVFRGSDLAVFDLPTKGDDQVARAILTGIAKEGTTRDIRVDRIVGTTDNDIVLQALELGHTAVLVEFNPNPEFPMRADAVAMVVGELVAMHTFNGQSQPQSPVLGVT